MKKRIYFLCIVSFHSVDIGYTTYCGFLGVWNLAIPEQDALEEEEEEEEEEEVPLPMCSKYLFHINDNTLLYILTLRTSTYHYTRWAERRGRGRGRGATSYVWSVLVSYNLKRLTIPSQT